MLKSGVMDNKRFEHSLNVTSQGGIVFSTIVQHIHARI